MLTASLPQATSEGKFALLARPLHPRQPLLPRLLCDGATLEEPGEEVNGNSLTIYRKAQEEVPVVSKKATHPAVLRLSQG
ncbi:hypothetical protein TNCV_3065021 [Trichonephila clavipes]|nr:hypothetical protein TNCV_3065021 [Trichonephila clavipes]